MGNISSKRLVDELIEDKEVDNGIIKTFHSKDTLCEKIFDDTQVMHREIRERLLEISDLFVDFVGVDFFIDDVVLTGSLANYNWSKFSDVDLHILIDMNDFSPSSDSPESFKLIIKEFFMAKKSLWNNRHDVLIKGFDVEVYVEDINEEHISSGVYSILNNQWVIKPQKTKESIDEKGILKKGEEYANLIDELIEKPEDGEEVTKKITDVRNKLKKFRQSGLENGGEYSYENLTFKLLRRNGYIGKLMDLKKSVSDKKLSINEDPDKVEDNSGYVTDFREYDAVGFGVYDNHMFIGYNEGLTTKHLSQELEKFKGNNFLKYQEPTTHKDTFEFYRILQKLDITNYKKELPRNLGSKNFNPSGRFWYKSELISFWEYPKNKNQLLSILNEIYKEMEKIYGYGIDLNHYNVEVKDDEDNETIIPIKDYVNSFSSEKIPHNMNYIEKQNSSQLKSAKKNDIEFMKNKEKGWDSLAQRNFTLKKNISETIRNIYR